VPAQYKAFEHFIKTGEIPVTVLPPDPDIPAITTKQVDHLHRVTGLSRACIVDLLKKGWTYKEELNQPPAWLHPMVRTMNTTFDNHK
jgi:hypothetical protein